MAEKQLNLPLSISGQADIGRLLRELEKIDEFLHQSAIRTPGSPSKLPKTSRLFDEIVSSNQLNMLHGEDRGRLKAFLTVVKSKAPVLHMSFSSDPSPFFMKKLVTYLRGNIHPLALVSTGLQPNIGAGCILRTTNQYFDLSLQKRFIAKRELLVDKLHESIKDSTSDSQPDGDQA